MVDLFSIKWITAVANLSSFCLFSSLLLFRGEGGIYLHETTAIMQPHIVFVVWKRKIIQTQLFNCDKILIFGLSCVMAWLHMYVHSYVQYNKQMYVFVNKYIT